MIRRRFPGLLTAAAAAGLAGGLLAAVPAAAQARQQPVRDWNVSASGTSSATTANGGAVTAGDTLVAYVEADSPASAGSQTATVSGCGQTWTLLARENAQYGDAEAWSVTSAAAQSACTVKAVLSHSGYQLAVTAADYTNAGAPTATTGHASSGAAAVTVNSAPSGSALWMNGDDWDSGISRTYLSGDTQVYQKLTSNGDTYWTEKASSSVSGTVTVGTSAPTGDQWNAVAVVIPPAGMQQQPPAAPTGLAVTGTTVSTASLSWTAPSGTVTGYYVYRNSVKVATVTSGTTYTDTGLAASTTYTYTVSAYNSAGEGPQSSSVQATTQTGSGSCPNSNANTPGGPDPWGGCFPGTGNTGVPTGTTLVNVDGGNCNPGSCGLPADNQNWQFNTGDGYIVVTGTPAVIDGIQDAAGIALGSNMALTVENSQTGLINDYGTGSTLTVQSSTLNGGQQSGYPTINATSGNVTVTSSDISAGKDGVLCDGNCDIENSWLHDNYTGDPSSHQQSFATDGGSTYTLKHDSFYCTGACTADVSFLGTDDNASVTNNLLVASPDSADCAYPGPNASGLTGISNMVWENNVFQKGGAGTCATYGPVYGWYPSDGTGNVWSGNTWDDGTALNE